MLHQLYESHYGTLPVTVDPMSASASNRRYCRLSSQAGTCIGAIGTDKQENDAFVAISRHFKIKGLPVPEVYAVSEDGMEYLQEDLGNDVLFDRYVKALQNGEGMEEVENLLCRTIALLPKIQFEGADGMDFSVCYPQPSFDMRTVMFDLNYFKYCFLKPSGLEFNEMKLQDDFERLADDLLDNGFNTFMYRDFNARNVMIYNSQPYLIDFQGGRKGPIYYDVASFVFHARAGFSPELRDRMLKEYRKALSVYMSIEEEDFISNVRLFVMFRLLQVLGAYGFRGWSENKAAFVTSIPSAIEELKGLVSLPFGRYPYLMDTLRRLSELPRLCRTHSDGRLEVKVYSFSYKKGIPHDPSGNGGGYVFDCRSIHNPGRYEPYKRLTGRDEEVIRFLEDDGEIVGFLDHVYGIIDPHVKTYMKRGFTNLSVSFGCTGGQHRSVYCAEHLAQHLSATFPEVRIVLIHREQNIEEIL